ncbi:N-acetyltransferase 8 [Plecturocebus cupreus]
MSDITKSYRSERGSCFWVAESEEKVVGMVGALPVDHPTLREKQLQLLHLFVDIERRCQGQQSPSRDCPPVCPGPGLQRQPDTEEKRCGKERGKKRTENIQRKHRDKHSNNIRDKGGEERVIRTRMETHNRHSGNQKEQGWRMLGTSACVGEQKQTDCKEIIEREGGLDCRLQRKSEKGLENYLLDLNVLAALERFARKEIRPSNIIVHKLCGMRQLGLQAYWTHLYLNYVSGTALCSPGKHPHRIAAEETTQKKQSLNQKGHQEAVFPSKSKCPAKGHEDS